VRPGDIVVAIDRVSVQGKSATDLVRRMRGKPGSTVTITIRRRDREKLIDFVLSREVIEVASIAEKSLDGNIAYLRLKQFQSGTHTELLQAISRLRAEQRIAGVILDLRNNPGGLVNEASAVADEFLGSGVVYTTRHRNQIVDEVFSSAQGALIDPPMVVLVNEYSASAAELLAGALQDHGRATIVGARTFGKGSVQSIIDLPGGAGLRLTTMRYYTPKGHAIQADGIKPDVAVEAGFIPDTSFDVSREQDLENHLPAESTPGSVTRPTPPALKPAKQETEQTGISPTHLGVARVVPRDPTGGPDFALSIGYQIVRGVLKKP
jgi:carboxyl-terminal processing protease